MVKNAMLPALTLTTALFAVSIVATAFASDAEPLAPKSAAGAVPTEGPAPAPTPVPAVPGSTAPAAATVPGVPSQAEAKPSVGDGIIAQNTLRIYLTRPATVTVHNARGQLLFHVDSSRPTEYLPLSGVHAGFLYVTFRAGPLESTQKLIYSGK